MKKRLSDFFKNIFKKEEEYREGEEWLKYLKLVNSVNDLSSTEVVHPTKLEYNNNIDKIQKEELHSARYKKIFDFVIEYVCRASIDEEEKLFKIIRNYDFKSNENLSNKDYYQKKTILIDRFNKLKDLMNSLPQETIDSNIYLRITQQFMEICKEDCEEIIQKLKLALNNPTDKQRQFEIEIEHEISEDKLELFPIIFSTQVGIPFYEPRRYKTSYINILDDNHINVYIKYNEIARKISDIIRDIYFLNLWEIISKYKETIECSHFRIHTYPKNEFKVKFYINKKKQNDTGIKFLKEQEECIAGKSLIEEKTELDKTKSEKEILLKITLNKHKYNERDELFNKYFLSYIPNEKEKNKLEELKKLIENFYNNTYKNKEEYSEFIPYGFNIGYLEDYGYYNITDYDRGNYAVFPLGENLNEVFKNIVIDILDCHSHYYEYENRQKLKEDYYNRFGDIEYFNCLYFAEYAIEKWNKYYNGNIPEEIIKYYENYLNNIWWSKENNIIWNFDYNIKSFNCIIKKIKTKIKKQD